MKAFSVFAIGCLAAASLWAASGATGEWTGQMEMRNGNTVKLDLVLKASGSDLTGTISSRNGPVEIADGKVNGNTVTFDVVREFNGNQFKQHYDGTLDGDTIHFKITMEGGGMGHMGRMGHHRARELDFTRVTK